MRSAHDCSDGGLAVTLAECCFDTGGIGAEVSLDGVRGRRRRGVESWRRRCSANRRRASSSRSRPSSVTGVLRHAAAADVPARVIGQTGGSRLRIAVGGAIVDRSIGGRGRTRVVNGDRSVFRAARWPEHHVRQVQGRVRRLRHLRSSRSGQHDLPRPVRAAASRPGERRHRRVRRRSRCASRAAMGYVADVFDGETLAQLPGPLAIGHVRYSTAGESQLANAQPILIDCAHGQIAICHNGNLVNARRAARRAGAAGLDLPVEQRHRGHPAPLRALEGAHRSRTRSSSRCRRCRARSRSCMLTQGPADRRPRSARLPAARARPPRRRAASSARRPARWI